VQGKIRKVSRKELAASLLAVSIASLALGWLLVAPPEETGIPARLADSSADASEPSRVTPATVWEGPVQESLELPAALAAERLANDPDVPSSEAWKVLRSPQAPAGSRYLALRRLERASARSQVDVADEHVHAAGASSDARQLAVNALGMLARTPEGRRALARYADSGPTEEVRRVASVLLARRR